MIRIGVDVGGTNTDAVVMKNGDLLAGAKHPTSTDIISGVRGSATAAMIEANIQADHIDAFMIGTTHFVNALVERKNLAKVGLIRLCLPSGSSLPPFVDWPADLVESIGGHFRLIDGGYEMDGREIAPLDKDQLLKAAQELIDDGCTEIALSTVFVTVRGDMEKEAVSLLETHFPSVSITASAEIGRMGLLERENAAIINGALRPLSKQVVEAFSDLKLQLGLDCPLYFTSNDGTLIDIDEVAKLPVLTFACGPTNSMRGAAFLSKQNNALVVDIGGTTTDVGEVKDGFPRLAGTSVCVADVQTNFSMPDVISVGLGGGSIVRKDQKFTIGPDSVGHRLLQEGRVFGGSTLTASDIAVASGRASMGTTEVNDIKGIEESISLIDSIIEDAVARSRASSDVIPVLAVGGGSVLMADTVDGLTVIRPDHHDLANAVGAAIAQVSGEASRIVQLSGDIDRDMAIQQVTEEAKSVAISRGACADSLETLNISDVPLAYLPGDNLSISVTVVGELKLEEI